MTTQSGRVGKDNFQFNFDELRTLVVAILILGRTW